jgi:hypothetical protein
MTLERKDLRLKVNPDDHAAMRLLTDVMGMDLCDWAEAVLVREVRRELHAAMMLADEARRLGIDGNSRECRGAAGSLVCGRPAGVSRPE